MDVSAVDLTLAGIAVALACLGMPLVLECIVSVHPPRRQKHSAGTRPAADILIPARNEAQILRGTLSLLCGEIQPGDQVWVIADNCSDDTAEIARSLSVEVVERHDPVRRGKGFALQYLIDRIPPRPERVAVILDADCHLRPGSLDRIVKLADATGQPVQSCYQMVQADASPRSRLGEFAILVKNTVRQRGLARLGLPCLLSGSGMAFPWPVLRSVDLANDNTADDLQLTCDLLLVGHAVRFCEEAVTQSQLPGDVQTAGVQRKRWIHGHLRTAARYVPRLVWSGSRHIRAAPLILAMEIAVPPLSLLVMLHGLLVIVALGRGVLWGSWLPTIASLAASGVLISALVLAWRVHGREILDRRALFALPAHLFGSLRSSLELTFRRQHWTPTSRDVKPLSQDG